MDVSAIAPIQDVGTAPAADPPTTAAPASTAAASSVSVAENGAQPQAQTPPSTQHPATLASPIAKIFGSGDNPQPVPLNVSYRVVKGNLGEIVTIFTDPKTGKEVAQFPPDVLLSIAQFFDQQTGATLDQNA